MVLPKVPFNNKTIPYSQNNNDEEHIQNNCYTSDADGNNKFKFSQLQTRCLEPSFLNSGSLLALFTTS